MFLYSILPAEVVLQPLEAVPQRWEEVDPRSGRRLLLCRDGSGVVRIERLVSTEPRDYLDPALQPGVLHRGWGPARGDAHQG